MCWYSSTIENRWESVQHARVNRPILLGVIVISVDGKSGGSCSIITVLDCSKNNHCGMVRKGLCMSCSFGDETFRVLRSKATHMSNSSEYSRRENSFKNGPAPFGRFPLFLRSVSTLTVSEILVHVLPEEGFFVRNMEGTVRELLHPNNNTAGHFFWPKAVFEVPSLGASYYPMRCKLERSLVEELRWYGTIAVGLELLP